MIHNYLKVVWRNFARQKVFSIINILGLAIGLSSCLLIALFIYHELSYDTCFKDSDRILRVCYGGSVGANEFFIANAPFPVGPALKNDYPEIQDVIRLQPVEEMELRIGDQIFKESRFFYADSNFFTFFSTPLKVGDADLVLREPHSVVIASSQVQKYFGNENPIGKLVRQEDGQILKITGIAEDLPPNTHFHFNFITVFSTDNPDLNEDWFTNSVHTYTKTATIISLDRLEEKFPDFIKKYITPAIEKVMGVSYQQFLEGGNKFFYFLQPLRDIHLKSNLHNEIESNGNMKTVYVFAAICVIILVIAAINFINLSTARATRRACEVGIRKTLGSLRSELIRQFLLESLFFTLLAMILAMVLVELFLPWFNQIMDRKIYISLSTHFMMIPILFIIIALVGIASGIYPAFRLSSFQPVLVLKGKFQSGFRGRRLRNGLVIFQFAATIFLFFVTYTIYNQITFMQQKNLGFTKDQIMVLHRANELGDRYQTLKNNLLQFHGIEKVSYSWGLPFHNLNATLFQINDAGENKSHALVNIRCDLDFQSVYNFEMVQGRFFSPDMSTDSSAIIINEKAIAALGMQDPIGKTINQVSGAGGNTPFTVIGVIKDFHVESLQNPIRPTVLTMVRPDNMELASVKVKTAQIKETMEFIETQWKRIVPEVPFEYNFFDDRYQLAYEQEIKSGKLFSAFSLLTVFIAALGLFGLSAFSAEQRTKEIGIRKVMGASLGQTAILLVRDYMKWILLASALAFPVGWYSMNHWLQTYTYRIDLSIFSFVGVTLIAMAIALLTVGIQTIKTALTNPVKALRYE